MTRPSTDELLARVPLFQDLSKKHLQKVAGLATAIEAKPGKVLTREGEHGQEFLVILEGEVEVRRGDQLIATRGPGDYVGEIALVSDGVRTATVVATSPVVVDVIGRREFATLLTQEPEIGEQIRKTAAQRKLELDAAGTGHDAI